jgi:putative hydrolase of the HAD superfamily
MREQRFAGLILDFVGVATSNMVEVIELFELREQLRPGTFLRAWASDDGRRLYRDLEAGVIDQRQWNTGFAALMDVSADNLMGRLLYMMDPAHDVLRVARDARAAGVRTALLSNSLGRDPYDPYAGYDLEDRFDVVVLSAEVGVRKPDPEVFALTVERLGVEPARCVFADDSEDNLPPAAAMGMTVIHALDESVTARTLRALLALPKH